MKMCTDERQYYNCSKCNKQFTHKTGYNQHKREMVCAPKSDRIQHQCQHCEYVSINKLVLNQHIRVKHPNGKDSKPLQLKCHHFPKTFETLSGRRLHILSQHPPEG